MPMHLESKILSSSPQFQKNTQHNLGLIKELESKIQTASEGGGLEHKNRHKQRGKLLARERIAHLLDSDSFFLELSHLAALDLYENKGQPDEKVQKKKNQNQEDEQFFLV